MSEFACPVVRIKIEPHHNADAIEIARVGDYQSIVKKGQFKDGDLAVYIPEQAVLPEWVLKEMGFWNDTQAKGTLNGSAGNRVKAIKLRGVLSQGLIYPLSNDGNNVLGYPAREDGACGHRCQEGEDVAEFLGIVKYEPPLPSHMQGRALGVDTDATHRYDFENLKKDPDLFEDGEEVVLTEKIHGTLLQVGVVPSDKANERYHGGRVIITSKGLGGKGIILDHNDEANLYAQAAKKHGLLDKALEHLGPLADKHGKPAFIFGEVFGKTASGAGVQDLTYTQEELDYRAFDICVGNRGTDTYLPFEDFIAACETMGVKPVPVLYVGPYSKEKVLEHTDGHTTLHGVAERGKEVPAHIREGVVVKSLTERRDPKRYHQRKIAKSVSEAYLLRKNATEFN